MRQGEVNLDSQVAIDTPRSERGVVRKRGDNPHRRGEIGRDETGVVRHRGGAIGAYNEATKQAMASSRNGEQSQW